MGKLAVPRLWSLPREERELLSAGVHLESPSDARDAATPEEQRGMLGFMLVALYAHTTSRRIVALKPIFAVSPSLRQKGDLFLVTDPQIC